MRAQEREIEREDAAFSRFFSLFLSGEDQRTSNLDGEASEPPPAVEKTKLAVRREDEKIGARQKKRV